MGEFARLTKALGDLFAEIESPIDPLIAEYVDGPVAVKRACECCDRVKQCRLLAKLGPTESRLEWLCPQCRRMILRWRAVYRKLSRIQTASMSLKNGFLSVIYHELTELYEDYGNDPMGSEEEVKERYSTDHEQRLVLEGVLRRVPRKFPMNIKVK